MILFYVKNNEALPVAMSKDQHQMLQILLPAIFGDEPIKVIKNKPQGTVENLMEIKPCP